MLFTQHINTTTGKAEWELQDEEYDYHQEIARSAFADMLHDEERNIKYYNALKITIKKMHSQRKEANVLDIGTGTGLLAMMAAECGADSVTACEAFRPMADCAKSVMIRNGFENKINLIPKHSKDLIIGPNGDMKIKANILVAEVFDTELIGEGALSTFRHALKYLLEENPVIIPSLAKVYIQVVDSELLGTYNKPIPMSIDDISVVPPSCFSECPGVPHVHDVQLSQIPSDCFKILSDPIEVFRFDFSKLSSLDYDGKSSVSLTKWRQPGIANVLFMWWDLIMEEETGDILSCAPHWEHPQGLNQPWRDHWMQGIYYLPEPLDVALHNDVLLLSHHDEFSYWFTLFPQSQDTSISKPQCICMAHIIFPRSRMRVLSDASYYEPHVRALKQINCPEEVCLVLSEGSLLPVIAAKKGFEHVYCVESNRLSADFLSQYCAVNLVTNVTILSSVDDLKFYQAQVTVILGEPHFYRSVLPWNNLFFWYEKEHIRSICSPQCQVLPCKAYIKMMAVEFEHLWKIKSRVGQIEGFNMDSFDELILKSTNISDPPIEPHPLWEYSCFPLSKVVTLFCFDLTDSLPTDIQLNNQDVTLQASGSLNGVVMWMDWKLSTSSDDLFSMGPTVFPVIGEPVKWTSYCKQAVYLFDLPHDLSGRSHLKVSSKFVPSQGEFSFHFNFSDGDTAQ